MDNIKQHKVLFFLVMFIVVTINAQTTFQNNGNIQIHEDGQVGFHTDVVNNGTFDQNLGMVGFYSVDDQLEVSGTNEAVFNNVEVNVFDNLYLETSITVANNLSFITGKVITPRDNLDVSLKFSEYFLHSGENDEAHVDGYVSSTDNTEFTFPIGDENSLRPMLLPEQPENTSYTGAYFKEDPNNPSTFDISFDTNEKQNLLNKISEYEFWDLNGTEETEVVLTWDFFSYLNEFGDELKSIRVVGWDKIENRWVDLGGKNITGDLNEGSVQSSKFIPDNYEVITIGTDVSSVLGNEIVSRNYAFTPNGDGINEVLVVEGVELRPNNSINIFNRWGALVFSQKGYDNTWDGVSKHDLTINKNKGLPTGTYFYTLTFYDEGITLTGYIYIMR
ncbi:gliding motility-associated C-terminal domain-containing protein [Lutibacter holmesii]|uniref:Gliding motility-associated C-terminal domain-containing protein n=1 Tax=Lutibacter holmesii TaxID=1137985 RepID=A0ABW3WS50_9FLAO